MRVLTITTYPQDISVRFRIEGDYFKPFYDWIMLNIPAQSRSWYPSGRYWLIDLAYFPKVFETAYEMYDRIDEFDQHHGGHARLYQYYPKKRVIY